MSSPVEEEGVEFGASLAAGDVDGDGVDELLVGCEDFDPNGGLRGGHAWLLQGLDLQIEAAWHGEPAPDDRDTPRVITLGQRVEMADLSGSDGLPEPVMRSEFGLFVPRAPWDPDLWGAGVVRITADQEYALGRALVAAELTGDGAPDLAAACGDFGGESALLGVCLLDGPLDSDRALADAVTVLQGDFLGSTLAASDLDGDGQPELVVGADSVDAVAGALYLLQGPLPAGSLSTEDATASFRGEDPGDWLGQEAEDAGDLDGDGLAEVVVSAMGWPSHERQGRVYLLDLDTPSLQEASLVIDGDLGLHHLGRAMAAADLDGDGQGDLVLGAPSSGGRVALFYGPLSGHLSAGDADRAWHGSEPGDELGSAMITGDLDGDGALDLIVAASLSDRTGRIYLLQGPL